MNTPDKPRYRPTHVTDASGYDTVRGTHRVKQVHYVLADGTKSHVEIPHDSYTAENVQAALEQAATAHEEVMGITPGSSPTMSPSNASPWSS